MLGTRPNYYDLLKTIAILLMIVDHVGFFLFPEHIILRTIGRISMPLFLFLVGYNRSGKISRSLIISAIAVDGAMWMYDTHYGYHYTISILWSIIMVKIVHNMIKSYHIPDKNLIPYSIGSIIVLLSINQSLYHYIDYGALAIVIGLGGLLYRIARSHNEKIIIYLTFIIVMLVYFVKQIEVFHITGNYLLLLSGLAIIRGGFIRALPRFTISYSSQRYGQIILFGSQYSLQIYMIHIVLFAIVSWMM